MYNQVLNILNGAPLTAGAPNGSDIELEKLNDSLYEFHKPPDGRTPNVEIIFFHGLHHGHGSASRAYVDTWTSSNGFCWPRQLLGADLPEARILSVSYDSSTTRELTQGRMDPYRVAENLLHDLTKRRVGHQSGCPVILVGKDIGGLVIKRVCLRADRERNTDERYLSFLKDIYGILFYSTPHRGFTRLPASFNGAMVRNLGLQDAEEVVRVGEEFRKLRKDTFSWTTRGVGNISTESELGIPEGSSRDDVDRYYTVRHSLHSIARSCDKNDSTYGFLSELTDDATSSQSASSTVREHKRAPITEEEAVEKKIATIASAPWILENNDTPAAIRTITRSSIGLVGGRVGGSPNAVEVWGSTNDGVNWTRIGTVASAPNVEYGDACFLSDGGSLVYCAFREHFDDDFLITVCRSMDGGRSWDFDTTVASNNRGLFLGAPFLWFSRDGNVQCYYDSEQVATDAGQPGKQWIMVNARPKLSFNTEWTTYIEVASRPSDPAVFARDGVSSVANLNGSDMMLVCESVDPANTTLNALYATKSHDNGRTWDFASRQRIWAPSKNGVQFNAYCPMAIRYGNGPVGVAFCSDDDFAAPSKNSTSPELRNAHVKFIRTLSTFEMWGESQTIETGARTMYAPGLFELQSNVILAIVDLFGGRQTVRRRQ